MENRLGWSSCKNLRSKGCTLMVWQISKDLVGLVLISPKRIVIEKSLRLDFSATNNEAEYEVLLEGMTMVQKMGGKVVEIFSDSRLVMGQFWGELEARDMRMQEYLSQVRRLQ